MCTSIVTNFSQPIIGFNLDILDMKHRVDVERDRVSICILDAKEGWMPLVGASAGGASGAMPTCWPYDHRSDPLSADSRNIIMTDIDLLLGKKTFQETVNIADSEEIFSIPGITFQAQLSDGDGNVLQIVPGQGHRYIQKPKFQVMTNFSPYKMDAEKHPWRGTDRHNTAMTMLEGYDDDFEAEDCFRILAAVSQMVCPTVVSMVFVPDSNEVYWCENRQFDQVHKHMIAR